MNQSTTDGLHFTFERTKLLSGFDGKECKIYPRLITTDKSTFLSYGMLLLSGSDVFNDTFFVKSTDGGKTFGAPQKLDRLETRKGGIRTIFSVCTEYFSNYHKTWFVFGRNTSYENDRRPILHGDIGVGEATYTIRDNETGEYLGKQKPLPLPLEYVSATPHGQVIEYENGEFLMTFYLTPKGELKSKALAVRYRYENAAFTIVAAGEPLAFPDAERGLDEPSVAKLGDTYYMTLRTDEQGLLSTSKDGLHYSTPQPWKWDDGSILPNYNTMQRWIRHKNALYLAYTRRGAHNDHIFRHRAPIFMARFDAENLCLIRETEVILVPELGARLGNFNVTELSDREFWLTTAEWMQTTKPDHYDWRQCVKYGSDNSIWIAKVRFE